MKRTNALLTLMVALVAMVITGEGSLAPPPSLPPVPPHLPPTPLPHAPPPPAPYAPVPAPPDTPCYPALLTCKNSDTSNPSQICCYSLEVVYKNGTDCICKVVESPELSKELGLNATEISNLLVECKITATSTSLCSAPAPSPNDATIMTTKLALISTIIVLFFVFLHDLNQY